MISVGNLDTPVTIESPTNTANANYGGIQAISYATALSAFGETVSPVWAYMLWKGGNEREDGDQIVAKTVTEFYIRYETYKDLIKPDWRIAVYGDNIFSAEVLINPTFDTTIAIGTNGSGWQAVDGNVAYDSGGVKFTKITGNCRLRAKDAGGLNFIEQSTTYRLQYKVTAVNSGTPTNDVDDFSIYAAGQTESISFTLGTHVTTFTTGSDNSIFQFQLVTSNSNITIDDVSLKKLTTTKEYYYIDKIDQIDGRHKMTKLTAIKKDSN